MSDDLANVNRRASFYTFVITRESG
jgi:hypothetical protein